MKSELTLCAHVNNTWWWGWWSFSPYSFYIFINWPTSRSFFCVQAAIHKDGEEGAVSMEDCHPPPPLAGVFLPVTSSPQVVIRVMATEMIKHQPEEEEEGSKQCGGLWCHVLLLLPLQPRTHVTWGQGKNPNFSQVSGNMHNTIYADESWVL